MRTQIGELPLLPEFPSAAQISQYVCDPEYLLSRMNMGSHGPTKPHLWRLGKIPLRTWEDCRCTSEKKGRTRTYNDLLDLLIELLLDRENASLLKNSSRGTWVKVPTPARIVVT